MNYVAGGVGKALIFAGTQLYGIANTLSDNTFDFTITAEDIRGGKKNVLLAQYFHDPNLAINLTNALFNFEDIALVIGSPVEQGGLSFKEEQVTAGVGGTLKATETPVATYGELIGWYKKPADTNWTVGTFVEDTITVPGAQQNDVYCLKYFWTNADARSITIKADYEPSEVHLVIIQDLFSTERQSGTYVPGSKAGSLITDIPRFKLNGTENLAFAAGSTATTSLSGNALAVVDDTSCEEGFIYGTMTEEIIGAKWQDNVVALAIENSEIALTTGGSEALIVRAVYGGTTPSQRQDNSNFTFTVQDGGTSYVSVAPSTGVVTPTADGTAYIEVTLTGYEDVPPAYAEVTVTGM